MEPIRMGIQSIRQGNRPGLRESYVEAHGGHVLTDVDLPAGLVQNQIHGIAPLVFASHWFLFNQISLVTLSDEIVIGGNEK